MQAVSSGRRIFFIGCFDFVFAKINKNLLINKKNLIFAKNLNLKKTKYYGKI